jgi:hypothetical protein
MTIIDDAAFIFGGCGYSNAHSDLTQLADLWKFGLTSGVWEHISVYGGHPNPRHACALVSISRYHEQSSMHVSSHGHGTSADVRVCHELWILGGITGKNIYLNDLWKMDLCADASSPLLSALHNDSCGCCAREESEGDSVYLLSFDGVDSHVQLCAQRELAFGGKAGFTIEAWVRPSTVFGQQVSISFSCIPFNPDFSDNSF